MRRAFVAEAQRRAGLSDAPKRQGAGGSTGGVQWRFEVPLKGHVVKRLVVII